MADEDRLARAIEAIDAANAEDPTRVVIRGQEQPKELGHARLMTEWLAQLRPDAGEAEQLAARAHHLRRWTMPRSDYPDGRAGYLRWRRDAGRRHAEDVAGLLVEAGCDVDVVARVQAIIRKEGLRKGPGGDPAVQAHEDARCLVFLETQLAETADSLGDRIVDVIRKTAAKMSPEALALAANLPLTDHERRLLDEALA